MKIPWVPKTVSWGNLQSMKRYKQKIGIYYQPVLKCTDYIEKLATLKKGIKFDCDRNQKRCDKCQNNIVLCNCGVFFLLETKGERDTERLVSVVQTGFPWVLSEHSTPKGPSGVSPDREL